MKKIIIAIIVIKTFVLVSCAKDYKCECTTTTTTNNGTSTYTTNSTITEKDKAKAQTQCTESKTDKIAPQQYTLTNSCALAE